MSNFLPYASIYHLEDKVTAETGEPRPAVLRRHFPSLFGKTSPKPTRRTTGTRLSLEPTVQDESSGSDTDEEPAKPAKTPAIKPWSTMVAGPFVAVG